MRVKIMIFWAFFLLLYTFSEELFAENTVLKKLDIHSSDFNDFFGSVCDYQLLEFDDIHTIHSLLIQEIKKGKDIEQYFKINLYKQNPVPNWIVFQKGSSVNVFTKQCSIIEKNNRENSRSLNIYIFSRKNNYNYDEIFVNINNDIKNNSPFLSLEKWNYDQHDSRISSDILKVVPYGTPEKKVLSFLNSLNLTKVSEETYTPGKVKVIGGDVRYVPMRPYESTVSYKKKLPILKQPIVPVLYNAKWEYNTVNCVFYNGILASITAY